MTPEERELLTRSLELAEENNKILRGMRRHARLSSFLRLVYWVIIAAIVISSYYFIKPLIDPVVKGFNDIQENIESVSNVGKKLPTWMGGSN